MRLAIQRAFAVGALAFTFSLHLTVKPDYPWMLAVFTGLMAAGTALIYHSKEPN
jgi:hypothetical protein